MAGKAQKGKSRSEDGGCCYNCKHASLVTDRWLDIHGNPTLCRCRHSKWLVLPTKCETGMYVKKQM